MPARGRNGGGGAGPMRAVVALVAGVLTLAIAFGAGILVGRHWEATAARAAEPREPGAPARKTPPGKRAALGEGETDRAREAGDKLTFYHTLAAPLSPAPSYPRPGADAKARPTAPAAAPAPGTAASPAAGATAATAPGAPAAAPAGWSVQVGAFGSRQQADTLQQDLRRAGFGAYLSTLGTPDGHTRFRVRVGTFADRALAQRTADRLRAERALPTLVTPN